MTFPSSNDRMRQAGAVPFRRRNGQIEFCLITTKKGKWVVPKGIVEPGDTIEQTALQEALEEAGLRGQLVGEPLGDYEYFKWGRTLLVTVFLMEVTVADTVWEESAWRQRAWFSADEAMSTVGRPELSPILEAARNRVAGQSGSSAG